MRVSYPKQLAYLSMSFLAFFLILSNPIHSLAQTQEELQQKIDQRSGDIEKLEQEIKLYQKQIDALSFQASSLSSTIKSLDLTKKKLETNIRVTEDKIASKNYEIQRLSKQIGGKESTIEENKRIISYSYATIAVTSDRSLPELLLEKKSLAQAWGAIEQMGNLQNGLIERIAKLRSDKANLETTKKATEKAKGELLSLNAELRDQRAAVLSTTAEKNSLLKETKQSETAYKQLLAEKKALKEAFEAEISAFEEALDLLVNPSALPKSGAGILKWPLSSIYITQYFGNTPFATANPQLYNGKGHTGVDFRASIGTPVKSSMGGIVVGSGNTDLYPSCQSYGKWIMIKHPNGLSTLYAHLSVISVKIGQEVVTGQVIGYSGNTGYSTGPHLHYGVYATEGVQIKKFDTSRNCKGATIPIADFSAYLNPLSYL